MFGIPISYVIGAIIVVFTGGTIWYIYETIRQGMRASHPVQVGPLITFLIGIMLSGLVGFIAGYAVRAFFLWVSGLSGAWGYIPFLPVFGYVSFWCFGAGNECAVEVGWTGVPKIFNKRIDKVIGLRITLSEGNHWMLPKVMNFTSVDTRIKPSDVLNIVSMSLDQILMRAAMFYKYRVTDVYKYLDAQFEPLSLDRIADSKFRTVLGRHNSIDLTNTSDEDKKSLADEITALVRPIADEGYGIAVLEAMVTETRLPEDLEAALTQKRVEEAKAAAEKVDMDAFMLRVDEMIAKGLSPEKAFENMQMQRGKVQGKRNIVGVEDIDGIANAVASAFKSFFGKD